jgi:hypothetical protein
VFQFFMIRLYMFKTVYVDRLLTTGSSQFYVCNYKNFTTSNSLDHLNISFVSMSSLCSWTCRIRIIYFKTNECSQNLNRGVVCQENLAKHI